MLNETPTRWHLGNIPVVSGGDGSDDGGEEENEEEEGEEEENDDSKGKPKEKSYSEARVQQMIKKRVAAAHRSAGEELAKSLGYESAAAMKEAIEKSKSKDSEEEKDLEKEKAKVKSDKDEAARLRAEATQERLDLQVERALLRAGIKPKRAEQAVRLIDLKSEDEPEPEDIKEAVEAFSEEWSELFDSEGSGEDEEDPPPPASRVPGSDPGRAPKKKPKGSASERASATLAKRHPELANKG